MAFPGLKYPPFEKLVREVGKSAADLHVRLASSAEGATPASIASASANSATYSEGAIASFLGSFHWHCMTQEELDLICAASIKDVYTVAKNVNDKLDVDAVFVSVNGFDVAQTMNALKELFASGRPPAILGFNNEHIAITTARTLVDEFNFPERYLYCLNPKSFAEVARVRNLPLGAVGPEAESYLAQQAYAGPVVPPPEGVRARLYAFRPK